MEHWSTFARFSLTIVNGPHTTASSMEKMNKHQEALNNITIGHQQSPPKLLPHLMRSSLMMPSMYCLLLQPLTHLAWNTLCILKIILWTLILRIMPTRPYLSLESIGVYMWLVEIVINVYMIACL